MSDNHSPGVFDGGPTWVPIVGDRLPEDAVVGGFENESTYVARSDGDSLCPGKYVPSQKLTLIPWGDREYGTTEFEILCGYNAKWVKITPADVIPRDALISGCSDDEYREPLYIGRAMHDGCLIIGKVQGPLNTCYLPYHGQVIEVSSYEILTFPKK